MSGWAAAAQVASAAIPAYMNRQESRDSREFDRWMYRNRHQMEVADLRKAGLNPILSAGSSPPGTGTHSGTNIGEFGNPVTAYLNAKQIKETTKNIHQDTKKKTAETNAADNLAKQYFWAAQNQQSQANLGYTQAQSIQYDNIMKALDAAFYGTDEGKKWRYIDRYGGSSSAQNAVKVMDSLMRFFPGSKFKHQLGKQKPTYGKGYQKPKVTYGKGYQKPKVSYGKGKNTNRSFKK